MARLFIGREDIMKPDGSLIKVSYYITKENKYYEELKMNSISYGFEVEKMSENEESNERSIIKDVTCNEEEAYRIAGLIKDYGVLPVHLKDVVEDLI